MKKLPLGLKLSCALAVLFLANGAALAQMPAGTMSAALSKLFGDISSFKAKAEVRVLDASNQEKISMPIAYQMLDKKVLIDIDLTQMKNKELSAGMAGMLKQMGMARITTIFRPDKNLAYVTYPDQKAMLSMPLPAESPAAAKGDNKLEKTALGKETIDGHPCVKNKVVITGNDGNNIDAILWNASDLKDFPIQIQTQDKEVTTVLRFKDVDLTKQDAKDFEAPTGYTLFKDQQELQQSLLSKMPGPAGSKRP
jgi:hypothetical protein